MKRIDILFDWRISKRSI